MTAHTTHFDDCGCQSARMQAEIERLKEAVSDLCYQFAYDGDGPCIGTGGLSALELAFDVLGWDDPHPTPETACDEPGCTQRVTCGTPSPTGYRRTCYEHRPGRKP